MISRSRRLRGGGLWAMLKKLAGAKFLSKDPLRASWSSVVSLQQMLPEHVLMTED
jgi:hypothetical protein